VSEKLKTSHREELNYALVEDTRPPIYTAMKYWGKKPHNIWRKYIENYTPKNGIYLDPFAGSTTSAFEAVKANRKVIAFDLNPLSSFIIEVFSSDFKKQLFTIEVNKIISSVKNDPIYQKYFTTKSRDTKKESEEVVCFKWDTGKMYEIGIQKNTSNAKRHIRYTAKPTNEDIDIANSMKEINISFWYPSNPFPLSPSFPANFLQSIGGDNFSNLWTKRNLYLLSKIFNEILKYSDDNLKKQLLFGFIQTLHLCSKMSVPRREQANRPFSTSWGRSAYLCSARQMEMNPIMVFQSSCLGKQSVESSLSSIPKYLGKKTKIINVSMSNKNKKKLSGFDIKYGIVDINTILDYIPENSMDFILTDPPYGGLVQYLDLSLIWLNWLTKYDNKYQPNLNAEITIKKGLFDIEVYKNRFTSALKNLYKLLKSDGKIVFTFHNKQLEIWNAFLKSVMLAGFKIEKVIHQQNRRTGEANVANPYGTSATDFYIRCVKSTTTNLNTDKDEFEHFVITKSIEIIALRNEPTPYQFLFNGILAEISSGGFDLEDFDANIESILNKQIGEIFKVDGNNDNKAGNYWWFVNPNKYIKYPDRLLTDRVEDSIIALLRRKTAVSFDDVLGDVFQRYPNGLTPDIKSIDKILKKYAIQSGGKWLYNSAEMENNFTKHTEILSLLSDIGHRLGFKVFIGKREQSEKYGNKILSELQDFTNIDFLKLDKDKTDRISMIDMLWIDKDNIKYIIEVENTTKFTSGIQRASNANIAIPKLMVVPDNRKNEFLNINDPLFIDNFKHYNWKYIFYSDIEKFISLRKINLKTIDMFSKGF
jgi:DNA modification methylase